MKLRNARKAFALGAVALLSALAACSGDTSNSDLGAPATPGGTMPDHGDGGGNGPGDPGDSAPIPDRHHDAGQPQADGATPPKDASAKTDAAGPGKLTTVFTILMENHDYNEVVGSPNAPYFNSLIAKYGLATNYKDSGSHPSLPNYLMMASGATQYPGLIDVNPTSAPFPVTAENLGSQLQAAGLTWRSYQESMGTACKLSSSGGYAPKHDPFLYFSDMQNGPNALCAQTNVDYSSFAADLAGGTYRFMWITPNLTSDGHDPTSNAVAALKASDTWAQTEITKILASPAYMNGGVIFLTWDEGEGRNGNSRDQVPMIVISERIKSAGFKSAVAYSHKSYLATVEDILGLPRLATVKNEPNMMEFFQ